jgi:hypothetical protein
LRLISGGLVRGNKFEHVGETYGLANAASTRRAESSTQER